MIGEGASAKLSEVTPTEPLSIGELLRQLVEDVGLLFRTELRLAQSEFRASLASAKGGAAAIAVGGIFLTGSLLAFLAAAVGFIAPYVGVGWAAMIVGGASLILGFILIAVGGSAMKKVSFAPTRTVDRLRRDARALQGED